MEIDTSELRKFAADVESESKSLPNEARADVKKAAQVLKEDYSGQASGSPHFKGLAHTVSYDMTGNAYYSEAEIGPDKSRGGGAGLAGFFLGWPNGGGGGGDLDGPLATEGASMMKHLDAALGKIL